MDVLEVLRISRLFAGLSEERLRQIAALAREFRCPAGSVVYHAGDSAEDVFLLVKGAVGMGLKPSTRRQNKAEAIRAPGEVVGWSALMGESAFRVLSATCVEEDTVLLAINGAKLMDLLAQYPEDGFTVLRRLLAHEVLLEVLRPFFKATARTKSRRA